MGQSIRNPGRYRELSVPHASRDELDTTVNAFLAALSELRVQHGIRDLLVVLNDSLVVGAEESEIILPVYFGDETRAESVAGYAYGYYTRNRKALIGRYVEAGAQRGGAEE